MATLVIRTDESSEKSMFTSAAPGRLARRTNPGVKATRFSMTGLRSNEVASSGRWRHTSGVMESIAIGIEHDHVFTALANADVGDGHTHQRLQSLDVILGFIRELVPLSNVCHGLGPAG
jgi:hypothetical protein